MTFNEKICQRLSGEWDSMVGAFTDISDERVLEPGTLGDWSMRDLMVHIGAWIKEAENALPSIIQGKRLSRSKSLGGGIDVFNARVKEKYQSLSPTKARAFLVIAYQRLYTRLSELPELDTKAQRRLVSRMRSDTYGHWRQHASDVRKWSIKSTAIPPSHETTEA